MAAELLLQQISADFVLLLLQLSCVSSPFLSPIAQHLTQLKFILWLSARAFLNPSLFLLFAMPFSLVVTVQLVVLSVCSQR
jgi:hypothetical protein